MATGKLKLKKNSNVQCLTSNYIKMKSAMLRGRYSSIALRKWWTTQDVQQGHVGAYGIA